ncbi:hypothetical protein [Pedobacter nyackensis]|uniref:Uncharacterized protein n=1 Tax=Pedobacter nyackensis TaxID=475255 RepID=A0A1W1ZVE4_9SPHI|nr:hypothetical protein [Pedobacter nyackensis]SMC52445.1 hypothetical protein SAMN04488101_10185 [Pedobacter nyackensis]
MTYTKKTTIEQYTAWLATCPPIAEILRIQKIALAFAHEACDRIIGYCKGKPKRNKSCLWIRAAVNNPTSKPQGIRSTEYPADWGDHPDANYRFRCQRMRENIERELAEEKLHRDALEILIK